MKGINHKTILLTMLLLHVLSSFGQSDRFHLKGKIDSFYNGKDIVLFAFDKDDAIIHVDTAKIANGVFEFEGTESLEAAALLTVGNYPDNVVTRIVFLQRGHIDIDMKDNKLSGTLLNNMYQGYKDTLAFLGSKSDSLERISKNKDGDILINSPIHQLLIKIGKYTVDFKKRNIHNLVGQYFFQEDAGKFIPELYAYPTQDQSDSAFYIIYHAADSVYKQKEWIKEYIELIEWKKAMAYQQKLSVGKKFTDFALTDRIGGKRNIADFIGESRFVYLDFWASWCGPCIADFPELKILYEKYDRSVLEIIGISLDTSEKSWRNALGRLEPSWIQLVAGSTETEQKIRDAYSISGIPLGILLDSEGNILYTLRPEQLILLLEENIDTKKPE